MSDRGGFKSCETLGPSRNTQPQFPHLYSGDARGAYFPGLGWGFKVMRGRLLVPGGPLPRTRGCPALFCVSLAEGRRREPRLPLGSAFCAEPRDSCEDSWPLAGRKVLLLVS